MHKLVTLRWWVKFIPAICLAAVSLLSQAQTITLLSPSTVPAGLTSATFTVTGTGFTTGSVVLFDGVDEGTTISLSFTQLAFSLGSSELALNGIHTVQVTNCFTCTPSNTVFLIIGASTGAAAPTLLSVAPGILSRGGAGMRVSLVGTNFRPGARVTVSAVSPFGGGSPSPGGIFVENATVVSRSLIIASVSVSPASVAGTAILDVVNADATSTSTTGTSHLVRVIDQSSAGAPLSVTTLALTGPRDGMLVSQGGELYGEAVLAGSGNGTVTGAWVWDGNIVEQFAAVMAGGNRVNLRSQLPFPTAFIGVHTVELRILQPNIVFSRPVSVMVGPQSWSTERIVAPEYGAFAANEEPPLLRWLPVPGAAKYQVGFATRPYFSSITTWHDVSGNEWRVPAELWQSIPEGEVYWTVRAVEMSGTPHKELPMRLLVRFPAGALATTSRQTASTGDEGLLLEWQQVHGNYVYRINISEDAAGTIGVRKYLSAQPSLDLHALRDILDPKNTYYGRVEALGTDGHAIIAGPAEQIKFPVTPPASATGPLTPRRVVTAPAPGSQSEIQTLETRFPAPDSTVTDPKTAVIAGFKSAPAAGTLSLVIDGSDVTPLAHLEGSKLSYTPAFDLVNGQHTVKVVLGRESSEWKFTVRASGSSAQRPLPQSDAELRPRPTTVGGATQPATVVAQGGAANGPSMQMQSQVGMTTQWSSTPGVDTNTISFGQQTSLIQGNWNTQINGSGLLNSTFAPEQARHSLGRVNNYVMQTAYQRGPLGMGLRFGVLAPTLYQDSQLVTPAVPRQGIELTFKTPAGAMGLYANTNDLMPGGGTGSVFHQQLFGASWSLPIPAKWAEFRLMWLSAKDSGLPVVAFSNALGQTLTASNSFAQAGGGDLYGGLLVIHLPRQWTWKSEYAWGYNTLDLAESSHHAFGRAWQSSVVGRVKSAAISLAYFDTGANFISPANPGLTTASIPSRRGANGTFALPTRLGTFTVGDQFSQSNPNSTNAIEQTMNAVTESWARNFGPKTTLSATLHETLVGSGDVPSALQTLPQETLSILQADQRDVGAALTATRQVGRASINLTGSRDWSRNNLNPAADVITTSLLETPGAAGSAHRLLQPDPHRVAGGSSQ